MSSVCTKHVLEPCPQAKRMGSEGIDREKVIQEIVIALVTLERCSDLEIENVKRFLRWMSDDALLDMLARHRESLQMMSPSLVSSSRG